MKENVVLTTTCVTRTARIQQTDGLRQGQGADWRFELLLYEKLILLVLRWNISIELLKWICTIQKGIQFCRGNIYISFRNIFYGYWNCKKSILPYPTRRGISCRPKHSSFDRERWEISEYAPRFPTAISPSSWALQNPQMSSSRLQRPSFFRNNIVVLSDWISTTISFID